MEIEEVAIQTDQIKLDQFLKYAALCASGGEAKLRIAQGEVTVNGMVCTMRGKKIRPGDTITLGGQTIRCVASDIP